MSPPHPSSDDTAHAEANRWTVHGIALLGKGDRDSLMEAQLCFEQAISLREELPMENNFWFRWGLTAGWMNRADALTRLGGHDRLRDALQSYDIAIHHLHRLPMEADPAFLWRLALAWMNRGMTEKAMADDQATPRALACIDTAIQVMTGHESSGLTGYQQLQAAIWMNRGSLLLQTAPPDWTLAAASARRALQHSHTCEQTDPTAAEAGIKARHTLCQALAHLLETPNADTKQADGWIHEATDAVEEVMGLTNSTSAHQTLREEMFRFGCRIYRAFQPHFLAEFLDDGITSGPMSEPMKKAARDSLALAAFQIQKENLSGYDPARLDKLVDTLQKLCWTSEKLGPQTFAKP